MTGALALVLLVLLTAPALAQSDRRVPSQYPTFEAAVAAAQSGDRIVLESSVSILVAATPLTIDKGLTVCSGTPGTRMGLLSQRQIVFSAPGELVEFVDVSLNFDYSSLFSCVPQLGLVIWAQSVFFRNVRVSMELVAESRFVAATLTASRVWLQECVFVGWSQDAHFPPCHDSCYETLGRAALVVNAPDLLMEDCTCRGGDGDFFTRFGTPCAALITTPGGGGPALTSSSERSVFVRCTFQDGHAPWFTPQFPPDAGWPPPPLPNFPGVSRFSADGGSVVAYDVTWIQGLPGQVAPMPRPPGPTVELDSRITPLAALPDARLGGMAGFSLDAFPHAVVVVLVDTRWRAPVVFGDLVVDPGTVAFVPGSLPWQVGVIVPNLPALVGAELVAQSVFVDASGLHVGNPAGARVTR